MVIELYETLPCYIMLYAVKRYSLTHSLAVFTNTDQSDI